jgi:DNA polymerase III alpha subunit (gram-positive type)
MNDIKWQQFLTEAVKIKGKSYIGKKPEEVLDMLDNLGDKTWIFFDTETTGLESNQEQLLEIAAVAVDPAKWLEEADVMDTFHVKIKLTDDLKARLSDLDSDQRKEWERRNSKSNKPLKQPQDVLAMTKYGEPGMKTVDQNEALEQFHEFVTGFKDVVLVAQNATFDMDFINTLSPRRLPRVKVIDTLQLLDHQVIPVLRTLAAGDFDPADPKVQKRANEILNVLKGSSSLGKVTVAYGISAENWHSALADTKMLMKVYKKIVDTLKYVENLQNINLRPAQQKAVKKAVDREKWFAKNR